MSYYIKAFTTEVFLVEESIRCLKYPSISGDGEIKISYWEIGVFSFRHLNVKQELFQTSYKVKME